MKCPKCGAENADDAKFCRKCGETLPVMAPKPVPKPVTEPIKVSTPDSAQNTKKLLLPVIIGVIVVVAVVVLIVVLMKSCGHEEPSSHTSSGSAESSVKTEGGTAVGNTEAPGVAVVDSSYLDAYADQLRSVQQSNNDTRFCLCYLDNDDVPELVICRDGEQELPSFSVYTWIDGQLSLVCDEYNYGEFDYAPYKNVYGFEGENRAIVFYGPETDLSDYSTLSVEYDDASYSGSYKINDSSVTEDEISDVLEEVDNDIERFLEYEEFYAADEYNVNSMVEYPERYTDPVIKVNADDVSMDVGESITLTVLAVGNLPDAWYYDCWNGVYGVDEDYEDTQGCSVELGTAEETESRSMTITGLLESEGYVSIDIYEEASGDYVTSEYIHVTVTGENAEVPNTTANAAAEPSTVPAFQAEAADETEQNNWTLSDLVTENTESVTVSDSGNKVKIVYPWINLTSDEILQLNLKIRDEYCALSPMEMSECICITYDCAINGDILSVAIVRQMFNDYTVCYTANISISEERVITLDELAAAGGYKSAENLYTALSDTLTTYITTVYRQSQEQTGGTYDESYISDFVDMSVEQGNLEKAQFYLNGSGQMCAGTYYYYPAGSGKTTSLINLATQSTFNVPER